MDNNKTLKLNSKPDIYYTIKDWCRHPFIIAAVACFFCISITVEGKLPLFNAAIPVLIFCFSGIFACLCILYRVNKYRKTTVKAALFGSCIFLSLLFGHLLVISDKPQMVILFTGIVITVSAAVYLFATRLMTTKKFIFLMFILGFLIRLAYIMTITIYRKQHDAGSIEDMDGHLGYIAYIANYASLPDIDVREVYQFYHPPLHHIIAAVWIKLQSIMGISQKYVWENIQILTLFYSCCCMILSYKLFRKLGLDGKGLCAAMAIVVFSPAFFILSGSINNDILSVTFMLGALVNTLYWYENRSFKRIICIALCVGLGMMTKLSVWMVTPAIAFIFIYVFFKNPKNIKKYIAQFAAFMGICAPLGLWWGIRNLVTHGVPITYIPKLSEISKQYIGDIPVVRRLFDLNPMQFENVGDQFTMYDGKYNEYNPLIALFKTSCFDELFTVNKYPIVAGWDKLLFWSAVIVGIIGFVAMVYVFVNDKTMNFVHKIFIGIVYGVMFVSYYEFCIQFPHVCTENIRYAVLLIVIGGFFFGKAVNLFVNSKMKRQYIANVGEICLIEFVSMYSCASVIFYYLIFMS